MKDEKTATAKYRSGICMLPGEVYRVCIARAAINESVCEDSHAEHIQFATAAVFTPILAEVNL